MGPSWILQEVSWRIHQGQYTYPYLGNHQYVRAYGSLTYTKAIAEFHKPTFGHIDHEHEICIVSGGVEGLFCSILGLVNPGE